MAEPKKDPFEVLNPFRKVKKNTTDTVRPTGQSTVGTVVSVSSMSSSDPGPPPPAATAATPRVEEQPVKQPKSPPGHQPPDPDYTPWTGRKSGEESPLYRKSLIGLRPYSPPPTGGMPDDMKIPHGLENPATKKEKGPDGLKEEISETKSGATKDGINDVMTDDGDKNWVDEDVGGQKGGLSPEILSSPIVRLVLDHTDVSGHDEKITFQVHRALLEKSPFLSGCLGSRTEELALDNRLKPYAVDAVIKYLYTGDIDTNQKLGTVEDFEGEFEKLTNIEWTSCYLGITACRDLAFQKIEAAYRIFEFGFNPLATDMRVKMTKWVYGLDDEYVEPDGGVHRLRRRVLAGWCRDISSVQHDAKLLTTFENLLVEHSAFSFDLDDFLTQRAREEPKMRSRLEVFKRAEKAGKERFEKHQALMFPGAFSHPSRLQLPLLRPKKATYQLPTLPSSRPPTGSTNKSNATTSTSTLSADAPSFVPHSRISLEGIARGNRTPARMPQGDSITPSKPDPDPKPEEPPLRKRASRISNIDEVSKFLGSPSLRQ
ncbi:hypothetical protein TWF281_009768 [Arthrobotrys megalospora]